MQKTLLRKFALVIVLCLLAQVPLTLVTGIVNERKGLRDGVVRALAQERVGPQVIRGPVLLVPYRVRQVEVTQEIREGRKVEVKKERDSEGRLFFLPEELAVKGGLAPDERRRGIYKAQAWSGQWTLRGRFEIPAHYGVGVGQENYRFGTPELGLGIADPRGIAPGLALSLNGASVQLEAGNSVPGLGRGVHAKLAGGGADRQARSIEFEFRLALAGLESVQFLPTGRSSRVEAESAWPHPNFSGSVLAEHEVGAQGFRAAWKTSFLSSDLQRQYADCFHRDKCQGFEALAFGVSFIQPVDLYQRLERTTKYGLLFIGLTFMVFLLYDILKRLPIHPVQYGLVGVALALFYLLLTSLSEHIAFGYAYAGAATACVLLIAFYAAHVLASLARAALLGLMLGALYAVLYVILLSEQHSLLMGSVLLFAVVAAIMVGTRRVNWYALGSTSILENANVKS